MKVQIAKFRGNMFSAENKLSRSSAVNLRKTDRVTIYFITLLL